MKTGKGFYSYPDPAYQQAEFFDEQSADPTIFLNLVASLVRSAALLALQDVAPTAEAHHHVVARRVFVGHVLAAPQSRRDRGPSSSR